MSGIRLVFRARTREIIVLIRDIKSPPLICLSKHDSHAEIPPHRSPRRRLAPSAYQIAGCNPPPRLPPTLPPPTTPRALNPGRGVSQPGQVPGVS